MRFRFLLRLEDAFESATFRFLVFEASESKPALLPAEVGTEEAGGSEGVGMGAIEGSGEERGVLGAPQVSSRLSKSSSSSTWPSINTA